jgi:hypothetical protein
MKTKILVALKTKYKTFGFSDKAFDGVADYLSKTVTDEANIETAVGGVEGLLKVFQGDVDSVRNEKSGLKKQLEELKKEFEGIKGEKGGEGAKKDDDVPVWAAALIESNKTLSEKLAGFEQKSAAEQRAAAISAKAKEHGIPESLAKRMGVPEDADLDEYFKDAKQDLANLGFKGTGSPDLGGGGVKSDGETFAAQIAELDKE